VRAGRAGRLLFVLAVAATAVGGAARAERRESLPPALEGVGIEERPGVSLPLEATFVDDAGKTVALGEYFGKGRPVVLVLHYSRCPMLCTLVLNGLVEALREVPFAPGRDYEIVTVSLDPTESTALARQKKQTYVAAFERPGASSSWHFLTGREEEIRKLAGALGFGYRYLADRGEYAHPAAIFVATADGRLSRTLYGVRFEPTTVRLALVEAGEGKVGTSVDRILLYCYHYDPSTGRYAPAALKIMRVAGAGTVLALGVLLGTLWLREARRRRRRS